MIIRQQQTQCSAQVQNVNYIHTQIKPHVNTRVLRTHTRCAIIVYAVS